MERFTISTTTAATDGWQFAPSVIRGWAYPLTWLAIIVTGAGVLAFPFAADLPAGVRLAGWLFYAVLLALNVWLNRGLKKGAPAAWSCQVVLSVLGVIGFPLGTAIHGYILSQWWKPATRAWFE